MKKLIAFGLFLGIFIGIFIFRVQEAPDVRPSVQISEPTPTYYVKSPEISPTPTEVPRDLPNSPLVGKINAYRVSNGAVGLSTSSKLETVARCRISYLIDNNVWSHDNFEQCFLSNHVSYNFGENLAKDFGSEDPVFQAWVNSPKHNEVMLDPRWRYIGVLTERGYTVATFSQ